MTILLQIQTARNSYIVRAADIHTIMVARPDRELVIPDPQQRPCDQVELGSLLHPDDRHGGEQWKALVIQLRRKFVGLLVVAVEQLEGVTTASPLPELLRQRLNQPWANGVLDLNGQVLVQLDLRAIAIAAAARRSA
jgi:hypothetical protein